MSSPPKSPPKQPQSPPRHQPESPRHLDFQQHAGLIRGEDREASSSPTKHDNQVERRPSPGAVPGPSEPQHQGAPIQPDTDSGISDADNFDSVYTDSDVGSITDTLSSSVKDYAYENGRRYHAYKRGEWIVPNDDKQQEQMDIFHVIHSRAIGDKLFLAPIGERPQRVLDLGCGTGIWVIDFADQVRNTENQAENHHLEGRTENGLTVA